MRAAARVLLEVRSVFFLVQLFQTSHGVSMQSSRDNIACSPDTQPRELTGDSGWFTSPRYPALYNHSTTCSWLITSTRTTVSLDFVAFDTQSQYDQVRIYDGNTTAGVLIANLGGNISPPPTGIHSVAPQMLVVFVTDVQSARSGFNATYASSDHVHEPDPCNAFTRPLVLADNEGTFQSNGFPEAYTNLANCQWLFTAIAPGGVGATVRLEFDAFNTEFGRDYVRIFDGKDDTATLIGELSGSAPTSPKLYFSSQQYLFLQFTSGYTNVRTGFNGTYTSQLTPTTTAFPPGPCGTNLLVSPREATIPPTHDIICQLDRVYANYLETSCYDLIQNLPGIGNADELVKQGGNFGCSLTTKESYEDAQNACYDNFQWSSRLASCGSCTRIYVCIRFQ